MIMVAASFTPSKYQQAIFDAVQNGTKSIVVSAVPGSGKTTTSKELIRYLPGGATVLALAFNRDASEQLGEKINRMLIQMQSEGLDTPVVDSRTIHKLGNATLYTSGLKSELKTNKYNKICSEYLKSRDIFDANVTRGLNKLVDVARLTLSGTDELSIIRLCNRFEIDLDMDDEEVWPIILQALPAVLQTGINQCKQMKIIDYTDMIWLPHVLDLQPKRFDYVLVDEAQDLSPAQRSLVLKARKANGSFIAVGDRNQSIYGFAGASLRSIDEIVEATGAVELPLSICYRCPKSVVDLAASIYPGIEASPAAAEGKIEHIVDDQVVHMVEAGDLILCRLTAPLVAKCLELLRMGKRATLKGRDLGAQFITLLEQVAKFSKSHFTLVDLDNLETCVRKYESRQIEIMSINLEENEMKIATMEDKISTLLCLHEAYVGSQSLFKDIDGFISYIKDFFVEDKYAQIDLSTGHRAKGVEYNRVIVLENDKLPHPRAKTAEALIQERNLMYVMYTRVLHDENVPGSGTLFLVEKSVPVIQPELPVAEEDSSGDDLEAIFFQRIEELKEESAAEQKSKHPGGRPAKGLERVQIKIEPKLKKLTEGMDRSALINKLLKAHFGIDK